jgi:hypothetical protein
MASTSPVQTQEGFVQEITPTHASVRTAGDLLRVAYDSFGEPESLMPGSHTLLHWTGWSLGGRPAAVWAFHPPARVEVKPLRAILFGFRGGCRRHAKYVSHELQAPSATSDAGSPARAGVLPAICPATRRGVEACHAREGDCSPDAFWATERAIGTASSNYEAGALALSKAEDAIACLAIGDLGASPGERNYGNRCFRLIALGSTAAGRFVFGASAGEDDRHYSLLSSYRPDGRTPLQELERWLARADHIRELHVPEELRQQKNRILLAHLKRGLLGTRRTDRLRDVSAKEQ